MLLPLQLRKSVICLYSCWLKSKLKSQYKKIQVPHKIASLLRKLGSFQGSKRYYSNIYLLLLLKKACRLWVDFKTDVKKPVCKIVNSGPPQGLPPEVATSSLDLLAPLITPRLIGKLLWEIPAVPLAASKIVSWKLCQSSWKRVGNGPKGLFTIYVSRLDATRQRLYRILLPKQNDSLRKKCPIGRLCRKMSSFYPPKKVVLCYVSYGIHCA